MRLTHQPLLAIFTLLACGLFANASRGDSATVAESAKTSKTSVGMPAQIRQIVLAGTELEAKPIEDRKTPVVLRIVATYPHGTAFRYDLEYYALEPGKFDLRDQLKRKDGSTVDDLPPLPIEVASLLPPGQIVPHSLVARSAPKLGGYRLLLGLTLTVWIIGLALLLIRRRARHATLAVQVRPRTLAERLQPLVTAAMAGQLTPEGRAELERLLLTYWRRRLALQDGDPVTALTTLRNHDEAGALLRVVESWLHKPEGAGEVDIAALLAPYRDLPSDAADSSNALRSDRVVAGSASGGSA